MRDYGLEPLIWDNFNNNSNGPGNEHCEHEWGDEQDRVGSQYRNDKGSFPSDCREQIKKVNEATSGQFCCLCNAWRGSLGLEPTWGLYIQHLMQIMNEVWRVLKPTGTCWVNMGDSFAGSGSPGGDFRDGKGGDTYLRPYNRKGLPPKSLCQIPSRFAIAMTDAGWILRNEIIWYKRNCMPSSAKDRFTVDFEKVYFFTKQGKYWFEQQREPHKQETIQRESTEGRTKRNRAKNEKLVKGFDKVYINPQGRNKRCVWDIPTKPFPEAHFAVFPEELVKTPILAGCPEFICKKCGKERKKIYKKTGKMIGMGGYGSKTAEHIGVSPTSSLLTKKVQEKVEIGYTNCGCNAGFEPGIVLDPFAGSGTVILKAIKLGRKGIGFDLNPEYCDMRKKFIEAEKQIIKLGL